MFDKSEIWVGSGVHVPISCDDIPQDQSRTSFHCEKDSHVQREVEDCPNLLANGSKAIVLDLVEIQDPDEVLKMGQWFVSLNK